MTQESYMLKGQQNRQNTSKQSWVIQKIHSSIHKLC